MKMSKPGLAAVTILAMMTVAVPLMAQAKETPNTDAVVAIVNGDKIFKSHVMNALKNMNVPDSDIEKVFPVITDQMINEKLIDIATAKAAVEKDPSFAPRLAAAKAQLLKTIYLENFLRDKITDQTVKAEYDKIKQESAGKQEAHARHIQVPTEAEALQVIKDLKAGAKFAALAKERSSGPTAQNGGDVGYFASGEILPEFSDAAFKLKPGTYTKTPVKTQLGWHVIYLEDKRARVVPDMKDAEISIRTRLGQAAVENMVKDLRAKASIKHFGMDGKPIEEDAAKKN